MSRHAAVFLDRDGTLVEPRHYPSSPDELVLYPDLIAELRHLSKAGFRLAVITNQSGIARGYFTEDDLTKMHESLQNELRDNGVEIDGFFYCPHHPDGVVPQLSFSCACRKPEPGLLLEAAEKLHVNLERSWFVGDILNDVEAGIRAGCRTILVDLGTEAAPDSPRRTPHYVARDSGHALRIIRAVEGIGPDVDLDYLPDSWHRSNHAEAGIAEPRSRS